MDAGRLSGRALLGRGAVVARLPRAAPAASANARRQAGPHGRRLRHPGGRRVPAETGPRLPPRQPATEPRSRAATCAAGARLARLLCARHLALPLRSRCAAAAVRRVAAGGRCLWAVCKSTRCTCPPPGAVRMHAAGHADSGGAAPLPSSVRVRTSMRLPGQRVAHLPVRVGRLAPLLARPGHGESEPRPARWPGMWPHCGGGRIRVTVAAIRVTVAAIQGPGRPRPRVLVSSWPWRRRQGGGSSFSEPLRPVTPWGGHGSVKWCPTVE
jgi:hypothetical protein